jgi:hypothetical protein
MSEVLTSAFIVLERATSIWPKARPQRAALRMMWAVDPKTGKLEARWNADSVGTATDRVEVMRSVRAVSAHGATGVEDRRREPEACCRATGKSGPGKFDGDVVRQKVSVSATFLACLCFTHPLAHNGAHDGGRFESPSSVSHRTMRQRIGRIHPALSRGADRCCLIGALELPKVPAAPRALTSIHRPPFSSFPPVALPNCLV